ncbi:MAG: hypothetical protein ABI658_01720, partial [Acidimicrobiales bacterium]
TLQQKERELDDTVKQLGELRARMNDAQRGIDRFDGGWSRFRNRDTIDTLQRDIDRASGWASESEARAATLRSEIAGLAGEHDRAVAHRDTLRPPLDARTIEIRTQLNADASLRAARVELDTPPYLRGIQRDSADPSRWRTTVGGIEQYRAAYGINANDPLGARPGYLDRNRADHYRRLDHNIEQLTPARARNQDLDMGIEL